MTTKLGRASALAEWRRPIPNEDAALKATRESVAKIIEILCADIDELESRLTPTAPGKVSGQTEDRMKRIALFVLLKLVEIGGLAGFTIASAWFQIEIWPRNGAWVGEGAISVPGLIMGFFGLMSVCGLLVFAFLMLFVALPEFFKINFRLVDKILSGKGK